MALRRPLNLRGFLSAATVVGALVVAVTSCGDSGDGARHGAQQATPGPQAQFVPQVTTASGVEQSGAPLHPASRFPLGAPVYVICSVQGVAQGQPHRLTVRWFLDRVLAQVSGAHVSTLVTRNGLVSFSLLYPHPGAGMAKLYWDEPVGDNNDAPDDHYLAQAVAFTLQFP